MIVSLALATSIQLQTGIAVTPDGFAKARMPQIAFGTDDRVYVSFGMGDTIYVSASTNGGNEFGAPVRVAVVEELALGMGRAPRIAAHGNALTVTAISHALGDLLAFRSTDGGATWSGPSTVNDASNSAREGLHSMAVGPEGELVCVWLDLRGDGTQIYMATIRPGDARWSENRLVYTSPSGTVCECCHPSVAFAPKGRLFVMFRNSIGGARDMYLTSSENLRDFSPATKLGRGTWPLDLCPMDGGAVAIGADGAAHTAWQRDGYVYSCGAVGAERRLGEGNRPWIATTTGGSFIVWEQGKAVMLAAPGAEPVTLTPNGRDPVVAALPSGEGVIVVWREDGIRALRVREMTGSHR